MSNVQPYLYIVRMVFGSHLYGTNTEDSDQDFMSVKLPSIRDVFLGKIFKEETIQSGDAHSNNTKNDIDEKIYSLHRFIEMACEGQMVALDMLHAPENMLKESTYVWKYIVKNREKFYNKNILPFVEYARKQAAKYGIKGSRLQEVSLLIDLLQKQDANLPLKCVWNMLPLGEHIKIIESNICLNPYREIRQVQIVGKKFQETSKIGYILPTLEKYQEEYGKKAILAKENKGIDWKAVSHAFRAAIEVKELLLTHTITLPLKEAEFIKEIKLGKLDYTTEVSPLLDELMAEVEIASRTSTLPEAPDYKFWESFIISTLMEYV